MAEPNHLSIREVLDLLAVEFTDITISKIRFLESRGLIHPERTPSGYRRFYEEDVDRLRWILRQQREHFLPLKVIKGRLEENRDSEPSQMQLSASMFQGDHADTSGAASQPSVTTRLVHASGLHAYGSENGETARTPLDPGQASPSHALGGTGASSPPGGAADRLLVASRTAVGSARVEERPENGLDPQSPLLPKRSHPSQAAAPPTSAHGLVGERHDTAAPATAAVPSRGRSSAPPRSAAAKPSPAAPSEEHHDPVSRARQAPPKRPAGGSEPAQSATPPSAGVEPGSVPPLGFERQFTSGASFTAEELAAAAGIETAVVAELVEYGLLAGRSIAGDVVFDEEALVLARLAGSFRRFGVEARHLRSFKHAAEREASLFAQVVTPLLRQRNPVSRERALGDLDDLAGLGGKLRAAFLRAELRRLAGG